MKADDGAKAPAGRARASAGAALSALPTRELLSLLAGKAGELVRKEVALAKAEVRSDLKRELSAAGGLGVAGLCLVMALQLLLTALVLALQEAGLLRGWQAALLVAAAVLLVGSVAGTIGWRRRVRSPLAATRRAALEGIRWAKERGR